VPSPARWTARERYAEPADALSATRHDVTGLKHAFITQLARVGLLRPTYRAYERLRVVGVRDGESAPDGLPLPPPRLRVRVAGTADPAWFLESGRLAREAIRATLERAGTRLEDFEAVLDFGCGCGRVTRHLTYLPGVLRGCDFDADAVAWCRESLRFATFEHNALEPPLSLPAGSVDFVYALSVLTHLPVELQQRWIDELSRVVRPGGLLLVTTHGERYLSRLTGAEQERFLAGDVVVRYEQVPGTNLCTAFHPQAYVSDTLGRGLELVDAVPDGAAGNPHQDLFLLRKPAAVLADGLVATA
jgi:SAM-dependent methyltransferase